MADEGTPTTRISPMAAVVLAVIVLALAVGVVALTRTDQGDRVALQTPPTTPTPLPTATPAATPSPTPTLPPTPTPAPLAFADCAAAHFGPTLAPLGQPANRHIYAAVPPTTINAAKLYLMTIKTARGTVTLCLQPNLAPTTVNVIVTLVRNHFYDGIPFHRLAPGFVIQGGDPDCVGHTPPSPSAVTGSCGLGGPGFHFPDEPVRQSYVLGALAMANSGPNTNGSQFFICIADDTSLPSKYSLFGKVATGLSVAQALQQGDLMTSVTVQEQV